MPYLAHAGACATPLVAQVVGDIYGEEGSVALGLPAALTAASFGKLVTAPPPEARSSPSASRVPSRIASKQASPKMQRTRGAHVAASPLLDGTAATAGASRAGASTGGSSSDGGAGGGAAATSSAATIAPTPIQPTRSATATPRVGVGDGGAPPAATPHPSTRRSAWPPNDADVTSALLDMVVQASAVLAKAHAASGKRTDGTESETVKSVFFCGGFVSANPLARAALARSLKALGSEALFFRHSEFLGAIGALARTWPGGAAAFRRDWKIAPPEARLSTDDGAGADSWAFPP